MAEELSIRHLGETLKETNVLKSLNLSNNFKVSESAFMYMIECAIESPKFVLESLNLAANGNLKKPIGQLLLKLARSKPSLCHLNLVDTLVQDTVVDKIVI